VKRIFDVTVSAVILFLFFPLLFLIALLIRICMESPVLFSQQRPGLKGKLFTLYKFRTMREVHDENGFELPDEQRLTSLGTIIRRLSLDELPQLYNVLKCDMSLVGPRPLLIEYLGRYSPEQARRHEVKPGITGWAQINGRNLASWKDRLEMDVWYVDNYSLWLDLKIILLTVINVFRGSGINHPGYTTMPKFTGTKNSDD